MTDPIRVAVLGYGFAGKTLHAPLIRGVEGLQLVGILSSNAAKVLHDLPDIVVYPTAVEVFADPRIDLIVIATPNDTHFDLARRGLEAGKHVVVDKPFTLTTAEGTELIALARTAGRLLSVFHSRRWDGDFLTVRQLITEGELGDVVHFESHYDRWRPQVVKRWREDAAPGSGIWFDLGSHIADQALQLFGPPEAVFADLAMQRNGAGAVDYFHVLLRYAGKRVVLHGSNLVAESPRRFEVHGTAGSFVKSGMDTQEPALRLGEVPGGEGWGVDLEDGSLTTWSESTAQVRKVPTVRGNYLAYYEAVRDAIASGGPNPVLPEEALAVMRLLELGEESSRQRRELRWV